MTIFSTFRTCPVCTTDSCAHHRITQRVQLTPCPFCQGPPVPFATSDRIEFLWEEDGTPVEAYVFCHECGAHGPSVDGILDDASDVPELLEMCVQLWEQRNARHRTLYDGGEKEGLNLFPRADHVKLSAALLNKVD
jgi:hypothetical protein